jgi:hypothetical protein
MASLPDLLCTWAIHVCMHLFLSDIREVPTSPTQGPKEVANYTGGINYAPQSQWLLVEEPLPQLTPSLESLPIYSVVSIFSLTVRD